MSRALELRPATPADVPAVRELTRQAYAKWVPLIGREPKPMTADYAEAVRNHQIDLVVADGAPVALIEIIRRDDHLLIENVAVLPAFQGQGLGRRLMAHAERLAACLGLNEIKLYTNERFAENLRLYARLGYEVEREEPFKGGVAIHMRKRLPA